MLPPFAELAAGPAPSLDELALALAAEFRTVDADAALRRLDALAADVREAVADAGGVPAAEARAVADVLGRRHGFVGDSDEYDHPDNSMLDVVLERRRGLPILLSVVYLEVARRADVALAGVGLPGHFVVGHFGVEPPLLIDPFSGGAAVETDLEAYVEPWAPVAIAMRVLNNLVEAFRRRGDVSAAIHAAGMRLALPADEEQRSSLEREMRVLRSRLN